MFPGPGAVIYRNEAGEPLGWDYPSDDVDYDLREERYSELDAACEDAYDQGQQDYYNGNEMVSPEELGAVDRAYRMGYIEAQGEDEEFDG